MREPWKQYHIVLVNLDPTMGSEIRKTRPCVIVSPDEMNKYLGTIIVCPVTSVKRAYPTRISITLKRKVSWIAADQIRTIAKERIIRSLGSLKADSIETLKSILQEMLVD